MAPASTGLELPETSLIAPLLPAMPASPARPTARARPRKSSPPGVIREGRRPSEIITLQRKLAPDTSRSAVWQYDSRPCPRWFFCRKSNRLVEVLIGQRNGVDV